tara:strand:- start:1588 stop:2112 length:525 start_codon:yes stop_codon:yes gene_type:complete
MKMRKNIVFLGMMGSGKTSIGTMVSKKLGLDFYDVDQSIEKEQNLSVSKIFKINGEKFFRQLEEKTTLNILKKDNIVISLGGGAFLNKNVRNEILSNHTSFWLKCDADVIIKRLKNNTKRPLAINLTRNDFMNLLKKRSKIYSKAMYNIDCDNLTKKEIVKKILSIYEPNKISS